MEKDYLKLGLGFDLNQTTLAYHLGGKHIHWTDYTIFDDEWDEDKYYEDFDAWWSSLSDGEREEICKLIL